MNRAALKRGWDLVGPAPGGGWTGCFTRQSSASESLTSVHQSGEGGVTGYCGDDELRLDCRIIMGGIITTDPKQTCNTPHRLMVGRRRRLLWSSRAGCFLACLSINPCPAALDNTSHLNETLCLIVKQNQLAWFTGDPRCPNRSARAIGASHHTE